MPFGFLGRKDGLVCTSVTTKSSRRAKTPNDSVSSKFSCNKRRLSLLWTEKRPLIGGGKVGSKLTPDLILPDLLLYGRKFSLKTF